MSCLSLAGGALLASNTFPLEGDSLAASLLVRVLSRKGSLHPFLSGLVSCVTAPRAAGSGLGGLESEKRNEIFLKSRPCAPG